MSFVLTFQPEQVLVLLMKCRIFSMAYYMGLGDVALHTSVAFCFPQLSFCLWSSTLTTCSSLKYMVTFASRTLHILFSFAWVPP